ncbi:MAG: response regulator transcription factor [Caldilineaceae bacterium]
MIRVLIADDHAIVRKGLRQIAKEQATGIEVDEAENGQEVIEKVQVNSYDVLVLDISMPGRNGLDILQEVRHSTPKLPVLILSMHPEEQYAIRMLKSGASGYLTKDCAPDQLVPAIQKIARGGKYVSDTLAERLLFDLTGESNQKPHELLSDREYSVLLLIGQGKTPTEIADQMVLSVKTVSTYRTRILEKLNLQSTAELIRYVVENNLT